ncbi:exonuclease domain-containing protein [Marinicrinis lubricantis]|uniref:Exonuclease domain-containing protein n=1 Tax=Marinicrinis lubricantis TaxID=2086470 RepID=A0ABW1IU65_9BACL
MTDDRRASTNMWKLYKMGGITPAIAAAFGDHNAQRMAFIRSMVKEQRKSSILETPLAELEAVVFDLETTGFMPQSDEIISIGGVWVEGERILMDKTFYTLLKPMRSIPNDIQKLTGIRDEDVSEAPTLIEGLQQFLAFVKKRVLIAHGTGHDKQFLNAALWKTSRVRLSHTVLDTMHIGKWLQPSLKSFGLDELLNAYGIPIHHRHHALSDSLMTAQLWKCYIEQMKLKQVWTVGDLYAYLSR